MICPQCQANNPCEAKFCMNCGTSLVLTCPNCSTQNVHYAKFCIECGHALRGKLQKLDEGTADPEEDAIKRFIPKEFAEKLESARRSQTMKGERRIVSILFCDVKGSTSMAEKLDPEEWAEIMNQAFEYLISPIYTYEGTLARLMGDSVLAFFGAPIAHEDDAKRAILAGLKIVNDIQPFKNKVNRKYNLDFDVRVGINTGLVVVGGVGSDLFMEYTALGDAINIASRMEQTALPGTIQVGEDTHKQTAGFFEFKPLEGVQVKGKSEPVRAYRVLGVKEESASSNGRQDQEAETALVGRTAELDTLKNAMESVRKGRGQVVCLVGEAGLGKSRLLKEAHKLWEAGSHPGKSFGKLSTRWNQASGLSYESSRPYGLIQRLIRNYIGASPNDSPDRIREKLYETLSMIEVNVTGEWLELFEIMLGVSEQAGDKDLSGENLKRKIYSEMLGTLAMLVHEGPTALVVDDLHWADPASAEFLVHLFQLADHQPILFLCSFRPHHNSQAWMVKQEAEMNYAHRYSQINLLPLSNSESNQLIDSRLSGAELPHTIRRMILRKSDGNPFFMEEVIHGLIDEKIIIRDSQTGDWQFSATLDDISIPDNLSAVITARIDRLEETPKYVLQMASVIGRSFFYNVLDLINDSVDDLDSELVKLQRMGLILEVAREPEKEYTFRQALTQETAYSTILLKHRREYHLKVGEAMLQLYSDRIEEFSSLLGHHFYQARDQRALQFFKLDGDAAYRLYANAEAINFYGKAIEVAKWKDKPDLDEMVDLYTCRGRAYELESQFKNALNTYKELEYLAVESRDKHAELTALIAQAQIYSVPSSEFNVELGISIIEKAEEIADELDMPEMLAKIYWINMNLYRFHQSLKNAQEAGEKSIALARELNLEEQLAYSLNDASHAYSMNGLVQKAKKASLEAAKLWKKLDNLPMLADSLAGLSSLSVYTGEYEKAYHYSDSAYKISQNINNIWGKSYSRYAIGLVDLERGEIDLAIEHLTQTIADAQQSQFTAGELLARTFLAIVYAELGAYDKAISVVEEVLTPGADNLQLSHAFFIGASLLVHARAGNIEKAEKTMEQLRSGIEDVYFIARYYFILGQCYLYLAKENYQNTLQTTKVFLSTLNKTGVVFLNAELHLLMGIALMRQGMLPEAKSKFREALQIAVRLGSRKALWQANYYLGLCALEEGEHMEAQNFFQQSQKHVNYILEHIEEVSLRNTFLAIKEIKFIIDLEVNFEK